MTNIGLIGDYGNINQFEGALNGILDITGSIPVLISNSNRKGHLSLFSSVSRETSVLGYNIVSVKSTGGHNIVGGDVGIPAAIPNVIVYYNKYSSNLLPGAVIHRPYHHAFVNVDSQIKLTGPMTPTIDAKYLGSDSTKPVPSLNEEEDWIKFGNGATSGFSSGVTLVNGMPQLAADYAALPGEYRITQEEFNALPVE